MSSYPVSPEENYNAICDEMKGLVDNLEQNPQMSEEEYKRLVKRYKKLGNRLEEYGNMMWGK